jgi:hypothetical protein
MALTKLRPLAICVFKFVAVVLSTILVGFFWIILDSLNIMNLYFITAIYVWL